MNEGMAGNGELGLFFDELFEEGAKLYPGGKLPERPAILVHTALSSFGRVSGGAASLTEALMSSAARNGATVAMPAHRDSGADSCAGMGAVAEYFRTRKGTRRSAHPILSFCASGPRAREILRSHRIATGLGFDSPVGALWKADALVLMLGTGYDTCTALHLVEYAEAERMRRQGMTPDLVTCCAAVRPLPFLPPVPKRWVDLAFRTDLFPGLGAAFESSLPERVVRGPLPMHGRLFRLLRVRELVEFSIDRYPLLQ